MLKETQDIRYCTILSVEQWNFLLAGTSTINRLKCLYKLMDNAVRTRTTYHIKGIKIALNIGQVAASDVEMAEYMGCNRKTIGKLIDSLNKLGMVTTITNNRTSIHTLHFLTGWYVGGVLITNPHYVRHSAVSKGMAISMRTPKQGGLSLKDCDRGHDKTQKKKNEVSSVTNRSFPCCPEKSVKQTGNKD